MVDIADFKFPKDPRINDLLINDSKSEQVDKKTFIKELHSQVTFLSERNKMKLKI